MFSKIYIPVFTTPFFLIFLRFLATLIAHGKNMI